MPDQEDEVLLPMPSLFWRTMRRRLIVAACCGLAMCALLLLNLAWHDTRTSSGFPVWTRRPSGVPINLQTIDDPVKEHNRSNRTKAVPKFSQHVCVNCPCSMLMLAW